MQDRDGELERIQTVEGAAPLAAAVAADALAHSLPGLNLLLAPASELFGATVRLWSAGVRAELPDLPGHAWHPDRKGAAGASSCSLSLPTALGHA